MAKKATGERVTRSVDGVWSKRLRLCGQKITIKIPHAKNEAQAEERAIQLVELAARMTLSRVDPVLGRDGLGRVAAAPGGITLKAACEYVDELIDGWRPPSACPTLGAIAERWNSNELHRLYPDDVEWRKESTTIRACKETLNKYVLSKLGDVPVDMITRQMCNEVRMAVASIPRANSRRQALTPLRVLLDLCVHPLELIESSPLPAGWLPSVGETRELQWLRPWEDTQLMACTKIPLEWRVLWGFYTRNGARESEAVAMTVGQFDLGTHPS